MNSREERHLDEVAQLVSLKRHEVPPPAYFQSFSDRVISQIEANQSVEGRRSLRERVTEAFDLKPFVAFSYGLSMFAVLVSAYQYTSSLLPSFNRASEGVAFLVEEAVMAVYSDETLSDSKVTDASPSGYAAKSSVEPVYLATQSFVPGRNGFSLDLK